MTSVDFRRLAFLTACTAYVVALLVVAELLSIVAAFLAAVLGCAVAIALTLEPEPADEEQPRPRRYPAGARIPERLLGRREIERRARQARGDDEDDG